MKKRNTMKIIKAWLAAGITALLLVVLFGVIFISLDLVTPGPAFFLELGIVAVLTFLMRIFWYDYAEDKRLNEDDLKERRESYFEKLDKVVTNPNDLDDFLVVLNAENREHFIKNKLGCRTAKNLGKKTKWLCFWHPSYKNLTEEEIGNIRFNNIYLKILRKADKLRQIKAEEIVALADSEYLYDVRNYAKNKKRTYQITSTILSTAFTFIIASVAFKEMILCWENVFRYLTYLFSIITTIGKTIMKAYRVAGDETLDWFNRLDFVLDKFSYYKKDKEVTNG